MSTINFKELNKDNVINNIMCSSYCDSETPNGMNITSILLASTGAHLMQNDSLLGCRNDQEMSGEDNLNEIDGDSDSDSDSKADSDKKRGKYRTYTEEEKQRIIDFMNKHGIFKTLEIFSGGEHKITKRKLKCWLDGQSKVKGVKGRKSNDPVRDQILYEWCMDFQNEHGRPPSRKEATQKALEISGDPKFQASKGWLDKFSKKYSIEFTPLKIVPPKARKMVKTESDSNSIISTVDTGSAFVESVSSFKDTSSETNGLEPKKNNSAPINEANIEDREKFIKKSTSFTLNAKRFNQKQAQDQKSQQSSIISSYIPVTNRERGFSALNSNAYNLLPANEVSHSQAPPQPLCYPSLDYSMISPLTCQNAYSMIAGKYLPMDYSMSLAYNYQMGFATQLQKLQEMMKNESNKTHENSE